MSKHHKVVLTEEQRHKLYNVVSNNNVCNRSIKAHILLLTARNQEQRMRDADIIEKLGTSICTIVRTRRLFCEKGLDAVIYKKRAKSRKPKYDSEVLNKTIRAIIANPPAQDKRWTIKLLTEQLKSIDINISQTLVHRTLQRMNAKLK